MLPLLSHDPKVFWAVWSKSIHWFTTKIDCKQRLIFTVLIDLKFGQGHLNLITSFPHPNNVSLAVWSKYMHWLTRYTAGKLIFTVLTALKIGSRSPNSDQIVYFFQ